MPKTILNEETGLEETVHTQEELDAALAEKDEHVKKKLEEFNQGKTSAELKEIEREEKLKEIQKQAEEAVRIANETVQGSRAKIVDFIAKEYVGEDPALRTKLDEAFSLIEEGRKAKGLDVKDDKSIQEMMAQAANMSGINTVPSNPSFPMSGGNVPNFNRTPSEVSDSEHDTFLKETGYQQAQPPKVD